MLTHNRIPSEQMGTDVQQSRRTKLQRSRRFGSTTTILTQKHLLAAGGIRVRRLVRRQRRNLSSPGGKNRAFQVFNLFGNRPKLPTVCVLGFNGSSTLGDLGPRVLICSPADEAHVKAIDHQARTNMLAKISKPPAEGNTRTKMHVLN